MPRFFFDIQDGSTLTRDTQGTECADAASIRSVVMRTLPAIARDQIPRDGDRQAFMVLVRNERDVTVYTATLTFTGLLLDADIPPRDDEDDQGASP